MFRDLAVDQPLERQELFFVEWSRFLLIGSRVLVGRGFREHLCLSLSEVLPGVRGPNSHPALLAC